MKTFTIKTFGCKVNQYESQAIREKLLADGYTEIPDGDFSNLCIVNTCCVTDTAEKKSRQYVNHIRRAYPDSSLLVTGCSVDYSLNSFGKVNFLVPNEKKDAIVNILNGEAPSPTHGSGRGISNFQGRTRAFVKVQDGCNQFCSYCVLPYVRGRSRSRQLQDVLEEVRRLVSNGYREVVLTGIHLGDYDELPRLLRVLSRMPGLSRIRLSSLEPQDITDDILEVVSENPKICRHFHIPLQSGSDRILKRMNRRYTYLEYKKLIEDIRKKIPGVGFTTDIMVGFPGETQEDFLATCDAVKEIGFFKVHIFPYSNRPGTNASKFLDMVPREEIKNRVMRLKVLADEKAYEVKMRLVGSLEEVLIESSGYGYTQGYMQTKVKGAFSRNELVKVRITGMEGNKDKIIFLSEV